MNINTVYEWFGKYWTVMTFVSSLLSRFLHVSFSSSFPLYLFMPFSPLLTPWSCSRSSLIFLQSCFSPSFWSPLSLLSSFFFTLFLKESFPPTSLLRSHPSSLCSHPSPLLCSSLRWMCSLFQGGEPPHRGISLLVATTTSRAKLFIAADQRDSHSIQSVWMHDLLYFFLHIIKMKIINNNNNNNNYGISADQQNQ